MSRCATCKGKTRFVPGNGPRNARVMCIGEAPGQVEDHVGIPLVGPTGQEFDNTYLPLAGLTREEVYVTNARKCRPDLNRKPTYNETLDCATHHLPDELEQVQPEIVMLMGATACSLIPGIDLEVEHGIPRLGELFGWKGWVVPLYHPALGLHETSKMTMLLEDWSSLKQWLKDGIWGWPEDQLWGRRYTLAEGREDIERYMTDTIRFSNPPWVRCGVDTETHGGELYSVQWSLEVGTGQMVLASNDKAMGSWVYAVRYVLGEGCEVVLHNAPADIPALEELGIKGFGYRDTMHEAYHLGNLPQALKALSYRLLGRRRKSWDETVGGPSRSVLEDWIMEHRAECTRDVIERIGMSGKVLKPVLGPPSQLERDLTRILKHMMRSDGYDAWGKLTDAGISGWPVKGIAHVPVEDAITYACSDADDCLAISLVMEELRKGVGSGVRWEDYDAI